MFHTERDAAVFMAEMLLLLGTLTTAIYAVAIVIALRRKTFRSLRGVCISLVISAVASIPVLCALALQWPYLPGLWGNSPSAGLLSLIETATLSFLWLAPTFQWWFSRRITPAEMRADA